MLGDRPDPEIGSPAKHWLIVLVNPAGRSWDAPADERAPPVGAERWHSLCRAHGSSDAWPFTLRVAGRTLSIRVDKVQPASALGRTTVSECNQMRYKIVYTRAMPSRFQIVESMLWQPPPGVDPETVRFHIDGWSADGRPVRLDDIMERRTEVIAEWYEPDECGADSGDPAWTEGVSNSPRPVWPPIERDAAPFTAQRLARDPAIDAGHDGGCVPFNGRIRQGDNSPDLARRRRSLECRLVDVGNPTNRAGCQCGLDGGALGIGQRTVTRAEDDSSVSG